MIAQTSREANFGRQNSGADHENGFHLVAPWKDRKVRIAERAVLAREIRQYGELAKYYDLLYEWKDYAKEARIIEQLIDRYKVTNGNALLDVGCGTGKHLQHLSRKFACVGMDVSEPMLNQARHNVEGVKFIRGNMVDFSLGRKFDVIVCLFSSIGFVRTYQKLARTLRNFADHLQMGGVVIIEPWFTKSSARSGLVHVLSQGNDELKIVRVDYTRIERNISIIDERIMVAKKDVGITAYRDRMVMGLFEQDDFLRLMRKAGFEARYLKKSLAPERGLYVGIKRN
jgi:ubiquinone/menaquinone biosynthesis C-methylase UbiE